MHTYNCTGHSLALNPLILIRAFPIFLLLNRNSPKEIYQKQRWYSPQPDDIPLGLSCISGLCCGAVGWHLHFPFSWRDTVSSSSLCSGPVSLGTSAHIWQQHQLNQSVKERKTLFGRKGFWQVFPWVICVEGWLTLEDHTVIGELIHEIAQGKTQDRKLLIRRRTWGLYQASVFFLMWIQFY